MAGAMGGPKSAVKTFLQAVRVLFSLPKFRLQVGANLTDKQEDCTCLHDSPDIHSQDLLGVKQFLEINISGP